MVRRFVLLLVASNQNKEVNQERLIFATIYLVLVLKTLVPDKKRPLCNSCVTLVIGPPVAKPTHEMGFVEGGSQKDKKADGSSRRCCVPRTPCYGADVLTIEDGESELKNCCIYTK